jgi:hypothetical protein
MPKDLNIRGVAIAVQTPYSEGHTLSAVEAAVLNQTFSENVRNNVAGKIKGFEEAAKKAGTTFSPDATIPEGQDGAGGTYRSLLQSYADAYVFGAPRTGGSEPVDPVEREARVIAREILKSAMAAQGVKRKDMTDEAYEQALSTVAASDKVKAEAKDRVKRREKLGSGELDLASILSTSGDAGNDTQAAAAE